jgi:hypothetical protein
MATRTACETVHRTAKSPMSAMVPVAFTELLTTVELVGRGAIHSPCCRTQFGACNSNITHLFPLLLLRLLPLTQPILHGLRNKPAAICTASHSLDAPLYPVCGMNSISVPFAVFYNCPSCAYRRGTLTVLHSAVTRLAGREDDTFWLC